MALDAPRMRTRERPLALAILSPFPCQNNDCSDQVDYQGERKSLFIDACSYYAGLAMSRPNDIIEVFLNSNAGANGRSPPEKDCNEITTCEYSDICHERLSYVTRLYQDHFAYASKSPFHSVKVSMKSRDNAHHYLWPKSTISWLPDPSKGADTISFSEAQAILERKSFGMVVRNDELLLSSEESVVLQTCNNYECTQSISASNLLKYYCDARTDCVAVVCKSANFCLTADDDTLKFAKKIPQLNLLVIPTQIHSLLDKTTVYGQRSNFGSASKYVICVSDSMSSSSVLLLNMVLRLAKPSDVILLTHVVFQEKLKMPSTQDSLEKLVNKFRARGFNILIEYERNVLVSSTATRNSSCITQSEYNYADPKAVSEDQDNIEIENRLLIQLKAKAIIDSALVHVPTYICIHCDASDIVQALCYANQASSKEKKHIPSSLSQAILDYITALPTQTSVVSTADKSEIIPKLLMVASNMD